MPSVPANTPFVPVRIVGSDQDWGNLVLSWADTSNPVNPPGRAYSDDRAWLYEFPDDGSPRQIGPDGAAAVFPDTVREVIFVRDTSTRRYVRLPDPVMVTAAQAEIRAGGTYTLPRFYWDAPLNCSQPTTPEQMLRLQQERVGDYSISSCM